MSREIQPGTDSLGNSTGPDEDGIEHRGLALSGAGRDRWSSDWSWPVPCSLATAHLRHNLDLAGECIAVSQQPKASRGICLPGSPCGLTECGCARNRGVNHVRATSEVRRPYCDDPRIPGPGPVRRSSMECTGARVAEHDGNRAIHLRMRTGERCRGRDGRIQPPGVVAAVALPLAYAQAVRMGCRLPSALSAAVTGYIVVASALGCLPAVGFRRGLASRLWPSCPPLTGHGDVALPEGSGPRHRSRHFKLSAVRTAIPATYVLILGIARARGRPGLGGTCQHVSEHVARRPGGDSPRGWTGRGEPDRQGVAGGQLEYTGFPGGLSPCKHGHRPYRGYDCRLCRQR